MVEKLAINPTDEDHSERIQRKLFELGVRWFNHTGDVKHKSVSYLVIYPTTKEIYYSGKFLDSYTLVTEDELYRRFGYISDFFEEGMFEV